MLTPNGNCLKSTKCVFGTVQQVKIYTEWQCSTRWAGQIRGIGMQWGSGHLWPSLTRKGVREVGYKWVYPNTYIPGERVIELRSHCTSSPGRHGRGRNQTSRISLWKANGNYCLLLELFQIIMSLIWVIRTISNALFFCLCLFPYRIFTSFFADTFMYFSCSL